MRPGRDNRNKGPRVGDNIRAQNLRVIGPDGGQIGVLSKSEALAKAEELELDLVEIVPKADPPVARIMDYGKFRYDQQKKEAEMRKKSKPKEVKMVRLSLKIGNHDFENKLEHSKEFLERGHRVRVSMFFRGREITHPELGRELLDRFLKGAAEFGQVEDQGSQGREIFAVLVPIKKND